MKYATKTNNKTILLALVAVFAMIAAGAAVVMTSSEDVDAAPVPVTSLVDGQTISATAATSYYAETSMAITVKVSNDGTPVNHTFYVFTGATLTITFGANNDGTATFNTVTVKAADGSIDDANLLAKSDIKSDGAAGSIAYTANATNPTVSGGSVEATLTMTDAANSKVKVASNNMLVSEDAIAGYAAANYDSIYTDSTATVAYFAGNIADEIVMDNAGDTFSTKKGAATITVGDNTFVLSSTFAAAAGLAVTTDATDIILDGTVTAGEVKVTSGIIKSGAAGHLLMFDGGKITGVTAAAVDWATGSADVAVSCEPTSTYKVVYGDYTPINKTLNIDFVGFTIADNAKMTIPDKYTMNIGQKAAEEGAGDAPVYAVTIGAGATLDVWGTVKGITGKWTNTTPEPDVTAPNYGKILGTGTLIIRDGAVLNGSFSAAADNVTVTNVYELPAVYEYTKINGTVENDATYSNVGVEETLTILEGKTLTITDFLALKGTITVKGTLEIADGAAIGGNKAAAAFGTIVLEKGGKLINNGTMAKNVKVIVKNGTSQVEFQAVSGIDIGVNSSKKITVGGVIAPVDALVPSEFTITNVAVSKMLTVSAGVTLTTVTSTVTGTLIIDGTLTNVAAGHNLVLDAGAVLDVNGTFIGDVDVKITNAGADKAKGEATDVVATLTSAAAGAGKYEGLTTGGYTIEVEKIEYVDETLGDMYCQRAYIWGELVVVGTPAATGAANYPTLTMAGQFVVPATLELDQTAGPVIAGATIIVEGALTSSVEIAATWIGGSYSVGTGASAVYTVTGYEAAIAAVAGANTKTVTLNGLAGYEVALTDNVLINDKEIIASNDVASIIIPEGVILYVEDGGSFDADVIKKIAGKVVVEKTGSCDPAVGLYDVTSTDAEETTTYCGFQTALDEAEAGDTITITKPAMALASLSVPAGVTVVIDGASTVTIEKTIIVAADAALNVEGRLNFGATDAKIAAADASKYTKNSKITVTGTMDLSAAKAVALYPYQDADPEYDYKYNMTIASTGKFIFKAAIITPAIVDFITLSGVLYKDGTYTVLTSMETALEEGAKEIGISGDYSTTDDIVLDGATLSIDFGAKASFGTIDVTDGAIVTAGALTATITGTVGEIESAFSVSKFIGAIADKKVGGVYVMDISAYLAGSLTVISGEVTLSDDDIDLDENTGIIIAADGMLTISNATAIDVDPDAYFYVNGALNIAKDTGALEVNGEIDIDGSIYVNGDLELEDALIDGSIVVTETGSLNITGIAYVNGNIAANEAATAKLNIAYVGTSAIGAGASIIGKITLADGGFLMVFPGSDVSDATLALLEYFTAFMLNDDVTYGVAYAKDPGVAAIGDVLGATPIDHVVLIPGYNMADMTDPAKWTGVLGNPVANTIGAEAVMCFSGVEQTATVRISVATGMSIYVDGVKYASGTDVPGMAMGAHTVMVTVNPGYKYADGTGPTVTFDGKVLSGILAFTITPDMANKTVVLSAIGDIVVDQPDIPEQEKEDNSMIMILLGVLVVMVVILAIVTVIRMMRS